jgi:hypothetical protein
LQVKQPNAFSAGTLNRLMDRELFRQKTEHLLRWSDRLERHVLVKTAYLEQCRYCKDSVINQRIECSAYRLGSDQQHFKHKCKNCNSFVFDGSVNAEQCSIPVKIVSKPRPKPAVTAHTGTRRGRPRKLVVEGEKRPVGRPRKKPTV